jgi:hypothetical protein
VSASSADPNRWLRRSTASRCTSRGARRHRSRSSRRSSCAPAGPGSSVGRRLGPLTRGEDEIRIRPPVASCQPVGRLLRSVSPQRLPTRPRKCDHTSGAVRLRLVVPEFAGHPL